jgi:pyruvate/2-oxoglutarate dehydrogenase complex dihydrolipoamide acyltransferase (E2) component
MSTVAVVVAATATATAAASATTAASTTAATATVATAPATAPAATFARTRFVDDECAAKKLLAVERRYRLLGFGIIPKFCEAETTWLAGETVFQQGE